MAHDQHDFEKTFLADKTEFLNRMARYYVLDIIRCEMHNEGYALEGNTEESDLTWFARIIFENDHSERGHWDTVTEEVRERYLRLAGLTMQLIPRLMSRISARCIRISEAVNTVVQAEKLHEYYEKERQRDPARKV